MDHPSVTTEILERLNRLELMIADMKRSINTNNAPLQQSIDLGEWMDAETTMRVTNLGRTTLYKLRKENKISCSKIAGRGIFYKKKDFERLLKANELK